MSLRALASLASLATIGLTTCAPNTTPRPPPLASSGPAIEPSPSTHPAAAPPSAAQLSCQLPSPAPSEPSPGPAYVLVNHSGVLRIDDRGVALAQRRDDPQIPWNVGLVAGPAGELWVSDWQGVRVLPPGATAPRSIRRVKEGPLYQHLIVRSPEDIWAVTSEIDWSVVHYDGKTWTTAAERRQFPGKYSDIKFNSLQATRAAVFLSTWNGIWRSEGKSWKKVDPPPGEEAIIDLHVYRDQLVAVLGDHLFLREGEAWRTLGASPGLGHIWAVSDLGIVAGGGADNRQVLLSTVDGSACVVRSAPLTGGVIHDVAIDRAGRVWVVTGARISVLDLAGRVLQEWAPGTLEGYVGEAFRVAVAAGGPRLLPSPTVARTFDLEGKLVTYRGNAPMGGAVIELCPAPHPDSGCADASFVRRATAGPDGSFRLGDVPDGDFGLHVRPAAGESDCDGLFRIKGKHVSPARDCRVIEGGGRTCDLGTLVQCLPFEMPPPRHR